MVIQHNPRCFFPFARTRCQERVIREDGVDTHQDRLGAPAEFVHVFPAKLIGNPPVSLACCIGPGELAVDALRPFQCHPALAGDGVLDKRRVEQSRLGLTQPSLHLDIGLSQLLDAFAAGVLRRIDHRDKNLCQTSGDESLSAWTGLTLVRARLERHIERAVLEAPAAEAVQGEGVEPVDETSLADAEVSLEGGPEERAS